MKHIIVLLVATTIASANVRRPDRLPPPYGANRYGSAPPSSFTYGFSAPISLGTTALGDIESAELGGLWVGPVVRRDSFDILGGISLRRLQFSTPIAAPIPNTLQSVAGVIGAQGRWGDKWRARIEALPGLYSDFSDLSGDDFNTPVLIEGAYRVNDSLEVGIRANVDPFRNNTFVATPGVSWLISDHWKLELWLPRPQIEYILNDRVTLFGGGSVSGGSFRVAENFGAALGRPTLNGEKVDYREVRAGIGARLDIAPNTLAEIAGGWVFDRRFEFHERNLTLNGDGAPYVQFSIGAVF